MAYSALQIRVPVKPQFFRRVDNALCCKVNEEKLNMVIFKVHKLNHRPRPKKKDRIKIICCFSEFGCETVGVLYCIPRLLRRFPGLYVIVVGWHGREYLYRHLVDEYWELDEEHMWLRDYSRAMHHRSWNLNRIERKLSQHGSVIPTSSLGQYLITNFCRTCGYHWSDWKLHHDSCPQCKSSVIYCSMMTDTVECKKSAIHIPTPRQEIVDWAKFILPPRSVGVFARGRRTYGRNLPPEFYIRLIKRLEDLGYAPVWLGEPQSTLPCPVDHILDYSKMPESKDLEYTFAVICNLSFTVQFWTASSRLAGMMGVPFLLFESPEQIYASHSGVMSAQEGKRLELTTFGKRKIVLAHYHEVLERQDEAIDLMESSIHDMEQGNYDDVMGMVKDKVFCSMLKQEYYDMLR